VTPTARRAPGVRVVWLLGAALQLALPGAAAWADARLDAAGAHATAHIESHTAKSCARIHAPDCALCHYLSAPVASRSPSRAPADAAPERSRVIAEPIAVAGARSRPHPQPRAPPTLS